MDPQEIPAEYVPRVIRDLTVKVDKDGSKHIQEADVCTLFGVSKAALRQPEIKARLKRSNPSFSKYQCYFYDYDGVLAEHRRRAANHALYTPDEAEVKEYLVWATKQDEAVPEPVLSVLTPGAAQLSGYAAEAHEAIANHYRNGIGDIAQVFGKNVDAFVHTINRIHEETARYVAQSEESHNLIADLKSEVAVERAENKHLRAENEALMQQIETLRTELESARKPRGIFSR